MDISVLPVKMVHIIHEQNNIWPGCSGQDLLLDIELFYTNFRSPLSRLRRTSDLCPLVCRLQFDMPKRCSISLVQHSWSKSIEFPLCVTLMPREHWIFPMSFISKFSFSYRLQFLQYLFVRVLLFSPKCVSTRSIDSIIFQLALARKFLYVAAILTLVRSLKPFGRVVKFFSVTALNWWHW